MLFYFNYIAIHINFRTIVLKRKINCADYVIKKYPMVVGLNVGF